MASRDECRVERLEVTFESGDSSCSAWLYLPKDIPNPPVVVLGHGLGGTREMRLDAYSERFARAGMAALAFTYRHFGDSGGQPRQLLSVGRQLADWEAALRYVRSRPDVDGDRVAVWGSSFGGGHAIVIASRHPELRAAVAQCPFTDGFSTARALGPLAALRLTPSIVRDLVAQLRRVDPVMIPLAGPPGATALMNAADALPGLLALVPPGQELVNQAAARIVPRAATYRPGRVARKVRSPILFCVSDHDSVAPPQQTLKHARTAPQGEIRTYDAGHFDFYFGDTFELLVADQTEFLLRHLHREVQR